MKLAGIRTYHCSTDELVQKTIATDFVMVKTELSSGNPELVWLVARAG